MTISNRCTGMNFYNHLIQRNEIEIKVNYERVKDISNKYFFIKHANDIVNLDKYHVKQSEWLDSFANKNKFNINECYNNYWTHYLD